MIGEGDEIISRLKSYFFEKIWQLSILNTVGVSMSGVGLKNWFFFFLLNMLFNFNVTISFDMHCIRYFPICYQRYSVVLSPQKWKHFEKLEYFFRITVSNVSGSRRFLDPKNTICIELNYVFQYLSGFVRSYYFSHQYDLGKTK